MQTRLRQCRECLAPVTEYDPDLRKRDCRRERLAAFEADLARVRSPGLVTPELEHEWV